MIGAGLGVTGAVAGMAVVPAFGMKALLGHVIAMKVAGGGGIVGAGTNVMIGMKKKADPQQVKEKHIVRLPNRLGGKDDGCERDEYFGNREQAFGISESQAGDPVEQSEGPDVD